MQTVDATAIDSPLHCVSTQVFLFKLRFCYWAL